MLKLLLSVFTVSGKGWEVLSMSSLDSILCSTTSSKGADCDPTTETAFSLLLSLTLTLVPQHATANKMVLATTDC